MPVRVQTLDGGLGVYFQPFGNLKLTEVLASMEYPEEILKAARYSLVDLTHVDTMDITGEDVRQIATKDQHNAELNPLIVQAIIAPEDLAFGIGRIYSSRTETVGWTTSVFRDRDLANEWLAGRLDFEPAFEADYPLSGRWE